MKWIAIVIVAVLAAGVASFAIYTFGWRNIDSASEGGTDLEARRHAIEAAYREESGRANVSCRRAGVAVILAEREIVYECSRGRDDLEPRCYVVLEGEVREVGSDLDESFRCVFSSGLHEYFFDRREPVASSVESEPEHAFEGWKQCAELDEQDLVEVAGEFMVQPTADAVADAVAFYEVGEHKGLGHEAAKHGCLAAYAHPG